MKSDRKATGTASSPSPAPASIEPGTVLPATVIGEVMSVSTVASIFKVDSRTVRSWIGSGKLRAHRRKEGSPWEIHRADLKDLL